jgi:hypothetical protein
MRQRDRFDGALRHLTGFPFERHTFLSKVPADQAGSGASGEAPHSLVDIRFTNNATIVGCWCVGSALEVPG